MKFAPNLAYYFIYYICPVPDVVVRCTRFVESHGLTDGVYRVSGITSNIKRLRSLFDLGTAPPSLHSEPWISQDLHCVPALVKLFFRDLPRPLISEEAFPLLREALAIREANSDSRVALDHFRKALYKLSAGHYK